MVDGRVSAERVEHVAARYPCRTSMTSRRGVRDEARRRAIKQRDCARRVQETFWMVDDRSSAGAARACGYGAALLQIMNVRR
jgi:hypothetical protein